MARLSLGLLLLLGTPLAAADRKPLTHADSDIWNTATGVTLSPDGTHLAYVVRPGGDGDQDGAVVLKNLATGTETRFPTGTRQPPTPPVPGEPPPAEPPAPPAGGPTGLPAFSPDSRRLVVPLLPGKAEVTKAKADGKPGDPPPAGVLAVIDMAGAKVVERLPRVRSFAVVGTGAGVLLATLEPKPADKEKPKDGKKAEVAPMPRPAGDDDQETAQKGKRGGGVGPFGFGGGKGATPGARPAGNELLVRNLADATTHTIPDVGEYVASRDHALLVYTVAGKTPEGNGVFATPLGAGPGKPVAAAPLRFTRLTWDETQARLGFFASDPPPEPAKLADDKKDESKKDDAPAPPARVRVYVWDRGADKAAEVLSPATPGLPAGSGFADRGGLSFSADGLKLAVSTAPLPASAKKEPVKPEDAVALDIWHWKDDAIQPMQKVRATADRTRSFRGVYLLDSKQFRQLADADTDVAVPDHGDWGLASTEKRFRGQQWLSPTPRDYSLVNVRTGESRPLVAGALGGVLRSPAGGFAVRFEGKSWFGTALPEVKWADLTGKLKEGFVNDEHDTPNAAPAWGFVDWLRDGRHCLVADKFDLWVLDAAGADAPKNLTAGAGRAAGVRFRPRTFPDPEAAPEKGLDLSKPVLLEAENLSTHDTGFYRLPTGGKPQLLVMAGKRFGPPARAKRADVLLVTAQTFADHPDHHLTDGSFRELRRVTDLNPRVREFNWGTAELVGYTTADGVPLTGMLVKPQDFDPAKKYPMIVYIYERLAGGLHGFRLPTVGTSINPTYYASNGYLVFMPDIVYTTGAPGQSALKCVLPAIQAVADKGYLDEARVGIQGHSWGGYQIAYLVTQTNRFKAAAAGAPVSNMTSAYGGIRWGTGLPRQFQYEQTQSRIGKPLWDAAMKYIDNSPLFHADAVATPLLMLHNDQDDAVPWYQGIEYYLALRRLGKEVYLLNYNGEFHGLRRKAAQRDYTVRMQQFFDHHLKGAAAPGWMADGVKYLDRDAEKDAVRKAFQR